MPRLLPENSHVSDPGTPPSDAGALAGLAREVPVLTLLSIQAC